MPVENVPKKDATNGVRRIKDLYEPGFIEANSNLCGPNAGENLRNLPN